MKKYLPIQINQEWHLRESNPYDYNAKWNTYQYNDFEKEAISTAKPIINHDGREGYGGTELQEVWQWYDKYEFEWRDNNHNFIDYSNFKNFYKNNIEACSDTRQVWKYIGEKPVEKCQHLVCVVSRNKMYRQCKYCGIIQKLQASQWVNLKPYKGNTAIEKSADYAGGMDDIFYNTTLNTEYVIDSKASDSFIIGYNSGLEAERTRIIGIIEAEMELRNGTMDTPIRVLNTLLTKINNS